MKNIVKLPLAKERTAKSYLLNFFKKRLNDLKLNVTENSLSFFGGMKFEIYCLKKITQREFFFLYIYQRRKTQLFN